MRLRLLIGLSIRKIGGECKDFWEESVWGALDGCGEEESEVLRKVLWIPLRLRLLSCHFVLNN